MTDLHVSPALKSSSLRHAIAARMTGPGGLYNIGNMIGLASGIGFALIGAQGAGAAIVQHLAGSPGAIALSLAMLVFFASGEFYHRAFAAWDAGQSARCLKLADALSGIGALLLAVSLICFGDVWLAITSTVLLAGGKFGNALLRPDASKVRVEYLTLSGTTQSRDIDPFRMAVVLSRAPAIAGLLVALTTSWPGLTFLEDGPTAILLGCYLLWLRADLLLTKTGS